MATAAELTMLFRVKREGEEAMRAIRADLGSIERGVNGVVATAGKLGMAAMGIQAVAQAIAASKNEIGSVVMAASSTAESMSKVNVVFGDASESIKRFADSADANLGLSRRAALEAAGTFGNLFTAMGFGGNEAADMSKNLLSLAADLASFNNISVDDALIKLRAGLVGETEPLRTLGVNLNAAEIEIKAVEMGLIRQGQELTAAGKAAAAYSLIFEQTKTAQGDFARTSDGLANQLRILDAGFNDLKASAGEALLPLATESVSAMNTFIAQVKRAQSEGFNVLDASLISVAASIRKNLGEDAARNFESITGAIGRMAEGISDGSLSVSEALGLVGDEIGRIVKDEWGPAFVEWAGDAKDATAEELDKLWEQQLKPWIEATGEDIGQEAKDKWIPALSEWAKENKDALRPGLVAMAMDLGEWSKTEGAQLMRDVGGNLGWAMLDAFDSYVRSNRDATVEALQTYLARTGPWQDPAIAMGGANSQVSGTQRPTPFIGPIDVPRPTAGLAGRSPADQAILDEIAILNADAAALQKAQDDAADILNAPLPEPSTGGSRRGSGGGPSFGRDQEGAAERARRAAEAAAKREQAERLRKEREEANTAIRGFMAELARDAPRWEQMFGEIGGRAALALIDAIDDGTRGSGVEVARSVQALKKEAERAGVTDFQALGDELAGSLHDALIDRGNPLLRAAALENLRAYTETIRQANALTPDSFARALDLEGQKAALGTGGRQVMDALSTALKEGGSAAIAALASSVAGMRQALFEDRDLTPEHAREVWTRIFGAVNAAIEDGTEEGKATLQAFFRDLNFDQLSFKVGDQLEKKIAEAWKEWKDQVDRANEQARQQTEQARTSLQEGRDLRGARDNVDRQQAIELENVVKQVNIAREAWRDYRDLQHALDARAREDADIERQRLQEDADLAKRLKEQRGITGSLGGGAPVGSVLNPNQGIGQIATDPQRQLRDEAKALQERRTREDAERSRRRGEQDADRARALNERREDAEKEDEFAGIVRKFREEQARNLRTFLDAQEEEAHERNLGRIQKEAQEAIAEAAKRRDTVETEARAAHAREMERINLQREGWSTVLDGYLADLEEVIRLQKEGPSGPIKTGTDISTEPLPVSPGPGPKTQDSEPTKEPAGATSGVPGIAIYVNVPPGEHSPQYWDDVTRQHIVPHLTRYIRDGA